MIWNQGLAYACVLAARQCSGQGRFLLALYVFDGYYRLFIRFPLG
jgi:hypothetical protein